MLRFVPAIALLVLVSCSTSQNGLFTKRTAHEKYTAGINDAGLKQTQLGNAWLQAAATSLQRPQSITLPYKESGYFAAEKPAASGYLFSAKRGEKIVVNISTKPFSGFLLFAELWRTENGYTALQAAMDTNSRTFQYSVEKDGQFIIRIQPELLRSVEYTISIANNPSLAFPVQRSGDPKMVSFWGAGRDGGTRSHEGIDIAAKFRTPALAAADGRITRVTENNLGGKVLFLNPDNTDYSLYYAHLDSQIAQPGQRVRAGDVVGLVGKTGNAQHTIPHLHFGIYTNSGAIDPLAFIDNRQKEPKDVTAPLNNLNNWLRTQSAVTLYESPVAKAAGVNKISSGDAVFVTAATDNWYKVQLPGGGTGFIKADQLTGKTLSSLKTSGDTPLLDMPDPNAPAKTIIAKGSNITVAGNYNNFKLVNYGDKQGWIMK